MKVTRAQIHKIQYPKDSFLECLVDHSWFSEQEARVSMRREEASHIDTKTKVQDFYIHLQRKTRGLWYHTAIIFHRDWKHACWEHDSSLYLPLLILMWLRVASRLFVSTGTFGVWWWTSSGFRWSVIWNMHYLIIHMSGQAGTSTQIRTWTKAWGRLRNSQHYS